MAIWIPVEDYGAIGDGVTNDQSAIQTAINTGNMVCLSANKTYLIQSSITINEGKTLYIPTTAVLKFDASSGSTTAVIMNKRGTLIGEGKICSSRYDWNYNAWDMNNRKTGIIIYGEGVKIEIGEIAGFEYGISMDSSSIIVCCNVHVGYFINILFCILLIPSANGCANQNYFQWNATPINWTNRSSFRSNSCGIYLDGAGEPNHNTFCGHIEDYYIGLRLSGAFNRFLGIRAESCDYTIVINDIVTTLGTRFNTVFGEYGNDSDFYNKILNQQAGKTIQYAVQIYGPEGKNWLNTIYYRTLSSLSDASLKKNIQPISESLNKILALNGKRYQLKFPDNEQEKENEYYYGFIAQEINEVLPELVSKIGAEQLYSMDYIGIIPIIVEAIKEQESVITSISKRLEDIEKSIKNKDV